MLAVIETHPVQYHAPVYRELEQRLGIPVTAIYGSDFSVAGYKDEEFGTSFAWDVDLLQGYTSVFLARKAEGGAANDRQVTVDGLAEALERVGPQAILLLGYSPKFHRQAFQVARRLGRPLLFRGETTDHARPRSWLKNRVRDTALRWFYQHFDQLCYVGEHSRRHFDRLGVPASKLLFAPYCVDTTPFQCDEAARTRLRAETRGELGLAEHDIAVLFSGKLSRRKGVDLLMAAVKCLPEDQRARVALVFLGEGELKAELEAAAPREPKVRAIFVGFQNQSRLSRYYHAADLLALPSVFSETWGLVVNEALHHGLPAVVSGGVGCAPDLIAPGKTGEVCRAGSVDELKAALVRAFDLVGRLETRDQCRQRVAGYTVAKAAQGLAEAYRRAVDATAHRSTHKVHG